jgi:hypothetical protein
MENQLKIHPFSPKNTEWTQYHCWTILGKLQRKGGFSMTLWTIHNPLLSLIAGILILIMPRMLNFIVAIYLIIIGLLGLIR